MSSIKNIAVTLLTTLLISNIEVNSMTMSENHIKDNFSNKPQFYNTPHPQYEVLNNYNQQDFSSFVKDLYESFYKLLTKSTLNNNIYDINKFSNINNPIPKTDNEDNNKLKALRSNVIDKLSNTNNAELNYKDLVDFNPEKLSPIVEKYWENLVTNNGKYIFANKRDFKPNAKYINNNNFDTSFTKEDLNKFYECPKNSTHNQYIRDIYSQVLSNYYYNVKEFKFTSEFDNNRFFHYYYAIDNSIRKWLNNNNVKDLQNEHTKDNEYSNNLLNEIADLYLDYVTNNIDEKKIEEFLAKHKELNIYTLANEFLIFNTLEFDKIVGQIVKFTLVLKDVNPKLNNKTLQTIYGDGKEFPNCVLQLMLSNFHLGICWLNSAFTTLYTIFKNADNVNHNGPFGKFIEHLQKAQFARVKEFDNQKGVEECGKFLRILTKQINLLKEFGQFIADMKTYHRKDYNEWMQKIESNELSKKAWEEFNKLIEEDTKAEKVLDDTIRQGSKFNYKNFGNNSIHGISLFINIFTDLKKWFEIKYDKTPEDDNKDKTLLDYAYNNLIIPIDNFASIEHMNGYGINSNRNNTKESVKTVTDILTQCNTKSIIKFPKYITDKGNNKSILPHIIIRITQNGELLIYQKSNSIKRTANKNHNYAIYHNNDGAQIMDDNNIYGTTYNNTDADECAFYKQVYKFKLSEINNKKSVDNNKKESKDNKEKQVLGNK